MIVDKEPFFIAGHSDEYTFEPNGEYKNYKKLRKQLGSQWKYYDHKLNPIVTTINELGYRSKTVYPTEEYYIALGCSNTFGQYLHEEERYSNIVEKQTGIPVINLGISGGSAISVFTNICKLLYSDYPKPKAVFIQWPEQNRLSINGERKVRKVHARMRKKDVFAFFVEGNSLEVMSKFCYDMTHKICDVPIIEFAIKGYDASLSGVEEIYRLDAARDNKHCGTETHKSMADFILGVIDEV